MGKLYNETYISNQNKINFRLVYCWQILFKENKKKSVIDESSLIIKIVALKMINSLIEKFNGSRFIHFKHIDRQIISINVNII